MRQNTVPSLTENQPLFRALLDLVDTLADIVADTNTERPGASTEMTETTTHEQKLAAATDCRADHQPTIPSRRAAKALKTQCPSDHRVKQRPRP